MIEHARQNGRNENVLQSIRDIQSVRAEYLDHAVKVLNDEYGSISDYLRDVIGFQVPTSWNYVIFT